MSPRPALGPLVRHLRSALEEAGKPDAALDARLIVEHVTGTSRADAVLDPDRAVPLAEVEAIMSALERRLASEPVYRIIGHRDFYGMRLTLSPGTLEPRPDTESLVDLALPHVRAIADKKGACRILDMGTGTGAIALALLREEPRSSAVGLDISIDALETAHINANLNGVADRFDSLQSSWFDLVDERFDVIVSNPPYIPTTVVETLEREVREHDPMAALDGGDDGLDAYREIAAGAAGYLAEDGIVAVEVGYDQPDDVEAIFARQNFVLAGSADDLGGYRRSLAFFVRKP